jgi:hypothetical protein
VEKIAKELYGNTGFGKSFRRHEKKASQGEGANHSQEDKQTNAGLQPMQREPKKGKVIRRCTRTSIHRTRSIV